MPADLEEAPGYAAWTLPDVEWFSSHSDALLIPGLLLLLSVLVPLLLIVCVLRRLGHL